MLKSIAFVSSVIGSAACCLYIKKRNELFRKIRSNILTPAHFKFITQSKKNYLNLTDEGKKNYLNTFFVNGDINMLCAKVSNHLYKEALEIEKEAPEEENAQLKAAQLYAISKGMNTQNLTNSLSFNTYFLIGDTHFKAYPDKEHNLPILLPIINRYALQRAFS